MQETIKKLLKNYSKFLFGTLKLACLNFSEEKPLTFEILENYEHPITKALLYLHSMETFIYRELKKACLF